MRDAPSLFPNLIFIQIKNFVRQKVITPLAPDGLQPEIVTLTPVLETTSPAKYALRVHVQQLPLHELESYPAMTIDPDFETLLSPVILIA